MLNIPETLLFQRTDPRPHHRPGQLAHGNPSHLPDDYNRDDDDNGGGDDDDDDNDDDSAHPVHTPMAREAFCQCIWV